MVLHISRPYRHPKTGTYWYRRRVPKELQPLLGRTEEKATLHTKEPAIARIRYLAKAAEVEDRWARLRAGEVALASLASTEPGARPSDPQPNQESAAHSFAGHSIPSLSTFVPSIDPVPTVPAEAFGLPVPWRPVFEAYAAEARLAASTVKRWWGVMEAMEKELGTDDLAAVSQDFLIGWKPRLLESGRSAGTVRDGYLGSIKAIMGWAVVNRKLAVNPFLFRQIKPPHRKPPVSRRIPLDTIRSQQPVMGSRPSCLVAERRWDMARWAIKAYAWRFAGVRRRAARRAR